MGALLPPRVISAMMTLAGMVTRLYLMHQRRSRSFVVAQLIRTKKLPLVRGEPSTSSIDSTSVGGDSGSGSDAMFASFVAVAS